MKIEVRVGLPFLTGELAESNFLSDQPDLPAVMGFLLSFDNLSIMILIGNDATPLTQ